MFMQIQNHNNTTNVEVAPLRVNDCPVSQPGHIVDQPHEDITLEDAEFGLQTQLDKTDPTGNQRSSRRRSCISPRLDSSILTWPLRKPQHWYWVHQLQRSISALLISNLSTPTHQLGVGKRLRKSWEYSSQLEEILTRQGEEFPGDHE